MPLLLVHSYGLDQEVPTGYSGTRWYETSGYFSYIRQPNGSEFLRMGGDKWSLFINYGYFYIIRLEWPSLDQCTIEEKSI